MPGSRVPFPPTSCPAPREERGAHVSLPNKQLLPGRLHSPARRLRETNFAEQSSCGAPSLGYHRTCILRKTRDNCGVCTDSSPFLSAVPDPLPNKIQQVFPDILCINRRTKKIVKPATLNYRKPDVFPLPTVSKIGKCFYFSTEGCKQMPSHPPSPAAKWFWQDLPYSPSPCKCVSYL